MEEFQKYFSRPLFTIIFRPKILFFVTYSILTGQTKDEFVIYWVLMLGLLLNGADLFISCLCQALNDLPLGQIKTDAILGGLCPSRRSFVYTYLLNFNSTRSLLSSLSVPMKLNATTKRQLRFDLIEHARPAATRGLGSSQAGPLWAGPCLFIHALGHSLVGKTA